MPFLSWISAIILSLRQLIFSNWFCLKQSWLAGMNLTTWVWIDNYFLALLSSFQKRSLSEKNSQIKFWFDLLNPWFNILCTRTYQRCCISIQSWWIIISIGGTKTLVCFAKDCFRSCSSSRRKFIGSLISETQKIGWYWDIKVSLGGLLIAIQIIIFPFSFV